MAVPQWRDGLRALMPNYFGGIVSNVEEILEMHKIATQSCFGTRSSVKKDPKQPSGKVHIKTHVLLSSIIARTVTLTDLLISCFYLFIYLLINFFN